MIYIKINEFGNVIQVMKSNSLPDNSWIHFEEWDFYRLLQKSETDLFHYPSLKWVNGDELTCQIFAILDLSGKRKQLLNDSDWTQIQNNPLTAEQQAAWATYRQELRDITTQSGYPFNVIWPTPPT
jgi:hypothetical protein